MNLKVVNRDGTKIHYKTAAIESFGKAFLLPLDCLIGWIAMPNSKLRVFNRISNTLVITTDYKEPGRHCLCKRERVISSCLLSLSCVDM